MVDQFKFDFHFPFLKFIWIFTDKTQTNLKVFEGGDDTSSSYRHPGAIWLYSLVIILQAPKDSLLCSRQSLSSAPNPTMAPLQTQSNCYCSSFSKASSGAALMVPNIVRIS